MNVMLLSLLVETFQNPRGAARRVVSIGASRSVLFEMLLLLAACITILLHGMEAIYPSPEGMLTVAMFPPLVFAAGLCGLTAAIAFALGWIGRSVGGKGSFEALLAVQVWLQAVQLVLMVAQFVITLLSPQLAGFLGFAASIYILWVTVAFVDAAHDFNSLGKSLMTLVLSIVGMAFALAVLLMMFGAVAGNAA